MDYKFTALNFRTSSVDSNKTTSQPRLNMETNKQTSKTLKQESKTQPVRKTNLTYI